MGAARVPGKRGGAALAVAALRTAQLVQCSVDAVALHIGPSLLYRGGTRSLHSVVGVLGDTLVARVLLRILLPRVVPLSYMRTKATVKKSQFYEWNSCLPFAGQMTAKTMGIQCVNCFLWNCIQFFCGNIVAIVVCRTTA